MGVGAGIVNERIVYAEITVSVFNSENKGL